MYKIDLHTHSSASPDGGIPDESYRMLIESKILDYIAVTDHNRIDTALRLQQQIGKQIIVGEEIMCAEGELIGLFLKKPIKAGMSVQAAAAAIKAQGGLVYVPHPFETVRSGISSSVLESIKEMVDIIEINNGRALFQNKGPTAVVWSRLNHIPGASSSDAHGKHGIGTSYSIIADRPTAANLGHQLSQAKHHAERPPFYSLLYPKYNRLRKMLRLS